VVIQKYDLSCGPAALATVLTYQHGDAVTERQAAAAMLRHTSIALVQQRMGFSLLDLKHYAESRGYAADGYTGLSVDDLLSFGPTIVPIKIHGFSHFVVFRGMQGDRVLLADPAYGNRSMPADTFEQMWENRIGFTINRTDGKPAPNMLAANASDFWATSGALRTAAPVVVAATAAPAAVPQAAPPAEQASVVAVSNPEPPPAPMLVDHASVVTVPQPKPQPQPQPAAAAPAAAPAKPAAVDAGALPKVQLVAMAASTLPQAAVPANQGPSVPSVAEDTATANVDPLLQRGDELLALGDVSSARRLYERGAAAGDGRAAASVGRTLDPYFLASMNTFGLQPDPQAAASWYRRAIKLGYAQAEAPLRRLSPAGQDQ
jgi:predicted double-glycine peptidase